MEDLATQAGWPWHVELVGDPDPILSEADQVVATADSIILDRCAAWLNLGREAVERIPSEPNLVEIS
jgi:hypothetical protein